MRTLINLVKRNLYMFFRNKSEVFFSFLSVIIILGLYVLFLSDLQISGLKQTVGDVEGLSVLVNSWVMSGLIAVSTVTLSLGSLGRIVADRQNNSIDDFLVAPINRNKVFLSYIISTFIIAFIISIILFAIAEAYIVYSGGQLLSIINIFKVLGVIAISIISSSLLMLFIISFVKNEQTYSVVSTIVGTLIGFVTGAYIPMGIMPAGLQTFSNVLPVSQTASLFRRIMMEGPATKILNSPELLDEYYKMQGVNLYIGNYELSFNFMLLFIGLTIVVFGIMNIIRFKTIKK